MTVAFEIEKTPKRTVQLAILLEGEVLWPHPSRDDGWSEFDPEDVLSYLADAWPSLLLTQFWPPIFAPDQEPRSITGLLRAAEDRWEQIGALAQAQVQAEAADIDAFLYRHDFASMKHGAGLPSLYLRRQAASFTLETNGRVLEGVHFGSFVAGMQRLGETARSLLQCDGGPAENRVVARWDERETADALLLAAYVTGVGRAELERMPDLRSALVDAFGGQSISAVANDSSTPLFAAARSSGGLGPAGVLAAIKTLQAIPDGNPALLDRQRRSLSRNLRGTTGALDQGIRAASLARDWIRQRPEAGVDLNALCDRLGIRVERRGGLDRRIDGLACIGPTHGPAIILNLDTSRRGSLQEDLERSLRFTWAHEIGHLLLDGDEWPALIDSMRQRVPRTIETRANAFAAYLLLPPSVAYGRIDQAADVLSWDVVEPILNDIGSDFGATRILASRQASRGAPLERRSALDDLFRSNVLNFDGHVS